MRSPHLQNTFIEHAYRLHHFHSHSFSFAKPVKRTNRQYEEGNDAENGGEAHTEGEHDGESGRRGEQRRYTRRDGQHHLERSLFERKNLQLA